MIRYAPGFRFLTFFAGLALTLSLQPSCLTNPSGPPTQEPTTITLSTYRIVFTAVNDHVRVDATVLDQDSRVISDATVNWRSADNSVARVSDRGVVTAAGAGTTQITVSSGYATATATVSVEQAADSIEITPSSITLAQVGETDQFTAVVYDANDRIIQGAAVVWSSSNPEIVTVDASGLVTAVSPGDALITASLGGVSTSRPVYVEVAPEPSRIVLNISEATLAAVGQSLQLDAQVYDDNNAAIPGAAVTWSSSRPEVATVDAAGLVIAVSNGTTRVTASSGDASAQATIHVVIEGAEPPPPEPPEPPPPPPPPVASPDRDALIVLYNATDGPNWTDNTNWLSDKPLGEWYGVATDNEVRVIGLELVENNLAGSLPPELARLTDLVRLNLRRNQISGRIPVELGALTDLTYLSLRYNKFSGGIPVELGNLTRLTHLSLGLNQLTGSIPSELGQLRGLTELELDINELTGGIPVELAQLSDLTLLRLNANQLEGNLHPELGRLRNLENLSLHDNRFTGSIPSELGQLESLVYLFLDYNALDGMIPMELGQLSNLRDLHLSNNQLEGGIPSELGLMSGLSSLLLSENQLTGSIPMELGRIVNLETLSLFENQLSGVVPVALGDLAKLKRLRLRNNTELIGPLPVSLTNVNLSELSMGDTQLCVPDDETFREWLGGIDEATGVMFCEPEPEPEPGPLSDRDVLEALYHATDGPNWTNNANWLSDEPLGEWYGVTTDEDGRVFGLALIDNNLDGPLPAEVIGLEKLQEIDVRYNKLSGSVPSNLADPESVTVFALGHNSFTGTIPSGLSSLVSVRYFHLGANQLTGSIPSSLGNLSSVWYFHLGENDLTGSIPSSLGNLSNVQEILLQNNDLSGPIPPELVDLPRLERLTLGGNPLTGCIPDGLREKLNQESRTQLDSLMLQDCE